MGQTEQKILWPDGKKFAFTIFDDTDWSTLANTSPVYDFLEDCGLKTTKSVWVNAPSRRPVNGGTSCDNREYLSWLQKIHKSGFEISMHMATCHTSLRIETQKALSRFQEYFGHPPSSFANHTGCDEGIYWGSDRLSGINQLLYNLLTKYRNYRKFRGHVPDDPLFWGDLCKKNIKYLRNFVFPELNTLKICPFMPYHDPLRPFVNYWFASSDGANISLFNKLLSEFNQDRLEEEGGACIMYTHFASGFFEKNNLDPRFRELVLRLSDKGGWFVPVTELLDFLLKHKKKQVISPMQRFILELRWLMYKLQVRSTT